MQVPAHSNPTVSHSGASAGEFFICECRCIVTSFIRRHILQLEVVSILAIESIQYFKPARTTSTPTLRGSCSYGRDIAIHHSKSRRLIPRPVRLAIFRVHYPLKSYRIPGFGLYIEHRAWQDSLPSERKTAERPASIAGMEGVIQRLLYVFARDEYTTNVRNGL